MKKSVSILFFLFTLTNVYGGVNSLGSTDVTAKFDALDDTKKLDFYYDFRNSDSALARFNAKPYLIDEAWANVKYLVPYRKNIKFLESFYWISKNPTIRNRIINHVLMGEARVYSNGFVKKGGFHFAPEGSSTFGNGKIVYVYPQYVDPRGHRVCRVEIKDSTNTYYEKKKANGEWIENDMFRGDWEEDELLENIALGYTTKRFEKGNTFIGSMSDGKRLVMYVNGNTDEIDSSTFLSSCFPFTEK